jgi:hypothetical protein
MKPQAGADDAPALDRSAASSPAGPTAPPAGRDDPEPTRGILAALNERQRAAVTHGEGPLLIVAGAGTGKTEVITKRIAWLIAGKHARPEEILALGKNSKRIAELLDWLLRIFLS